MNSQIISVASLLALASSLVLPTAAFAADEAAKDVAPAPAASAGPAPAASATPAPTTQTAPAAPTRCALVEDSGVAHAEANVATTFLCRELLRADGSTGSSFGVRIVALGSRVLVTVERQADPQATPTRRTAALPGLEEVPVAAPRLAEALVFDKKFEDTATVNSVLSDESRTLKTRGGRMGYDVGVSGTTAFGFAALPTAGLYGGIQYETASRLAVKLEGRVGGIGGESTRVSGGVLELGSRYYTSAGAISPFFGTAVGFSYWANSAEVTESFGGGHSYQTTRSIEGSGFNVSVYGGLQFMRLERVSFDVGVRLDVPVYSLGAKYYSSMSNHPNSAYMVPVSLNVGLTFH